MIDEQRHPDVRQEEDTIRSRWIVLGALCTLAVSAILIAAAWALLRAREETIRPSGIFPEERIHPPPSVTEIQSTLFGERGVGQELNERKREELRSFGWVDREDKRIRIPIDEAMHLVVLENRP